MMSAIFHTTISEITAEWMTESPRGSGVIGSDVDVGYFISQNLGVEDRRAHEDDLHAYHDMLMANGISDYDLDAFVADYRVGIACGGMIPGLAVGSLDFTSERSVALWTDVIERTQTALIDQGLAG
jgi:ABC-type amino acid transport substrate-binding protein